MLRARLKHWLALALIASERRGLQETLLHFAKQRAEILDGEAWCIRELDKVAEKELHVKIRARRWQQHLPTKASNGHRTNSIGT